MNLAFALFAIAENNFMRPDSITAISFEDGSKLKFNYTMNCGNFFAAFSITGNIINNTFRN